MSASPVAGRARTSGLAPRRQSPAGRVRRRSASISSRGRFQPAVQNRAAGAGKVGQGPVAPGDAGKGVAARPAIADEGEGVAVGLDAEAGGGGVDPPGLVARSRGGPCRWWPVDRATGRSGPMSTRPARRTASRSRPPRRSGGRPRPGGRPRRGGGRGSGRGCGRRPGAAAGRGYRPSSRPRRRGRGRAGPKDGGPKAASSGISRPRASR